MDEFEQVRLRTRYEHHESTPEDIKTYTTIGFRVHDGMAMVLYIADYEDDGLFKKRTVASFLGSVGLLGHEQPRFELKENDVITVAERDILLEELYEQDYEPKRKGATS